MTLQRLIITFKPEDVLFATASPDADKLVKRA